MHHFLDNSAVQVLLYAVSASVEVLVMVVAKQQSWVVYSNIPAQLSPVKVQDKLHEIVEKGLCKKSSLSCLGALIQYARSFLAFFSRPSYKVRTHPMTPPKKTPTNGCVSLKTYHTRYSNCFTWNDCISKMRLFYNCHIDTNQQEYSRHIKGTRTAQFSPALTSEEFERSGLLDVNAYRGLVFVSGDTGHLLNDVTFCLPA